MTFVYHGVPENMMGEEILSLNQLRSANLSAYGKNIEKYKGREAVIERNVPLLNCKASDVINLLPFNPKKLFEELQEIPVATKQYYKSMVSKKEAVFNYQFVPHVLTRGPINIKNCDVIEI